MGLPKLLDQDAVFESVSIDEAVAARAERTKRRKRIHESLTS